MRWFRFGSASRLTLRSWRPGPVGCVSPPLHHRRIAALQTALLVPHLELRSPIQSAHLPDLPATNRAPRSAFHLLTGSASAIGQLAWAEEANIGWLKGGGRHHCISFAAVVAPHGSILLAIAASRSRSTPSCPTHTRPAKAEHQSKRSPKQRQSEAHKRIVRLTGETGHRDNAINASSARIP